ncbi:hypothetical protein CO051_02705 [Candidatus Roizmanbacteria bacterium CG_4_9_14_0_2_um_filter_39_13]|uniref:Ribonuclease VapC n=2 Tax=Candidatus Roizmaniibacteriota TaxID=1752723 RepID=A0A2M8F070_9BACT|nr:MAG: hypothetical protein COY15_06035 [Candidatus Roizmanbacteria bacterium CG_4_10_14_0_2_um_filter_39_12]PJC32692.1 MAG: hypothetical protein CO051_02705 [Candidatus Roizmanbacteria bacterium CG_4_9_14_0_2_um_filter_39_13]PJE61801.1 MAG: hypothetical protein COU87_02640 [Candidatus Roizmanbacteria bacterium CG10_big_fil_rev_8_21_14_0_10_39_12]
MMYLLDSNILIYGFKGIEPYKSLGVDLLSQKQLALSILTVAEFLAGATKQEKAMLDDLLSTATLYTIDYTIARTAAYYREMYARKHKRVFLIDCLIAATAKVHNLTLVTNNAKDFPMKDIYILDPRKS